MKNNIAESDMNKESDKEDVLEKEENYADEEKNATSSSEEGLVVYYSFGKDIKDSSIEGNDVTNYGAVFVGAKNESLPSSIDRQKFIKKISQSS